MSDFHRADPRLRRLLLWSAIATGLLVFVGLLAMARYLEALHLDGSEAALASGLLSLQRLMAVLLCVLGLLTAGLGLWMVGLGRRIREGQRFPPADARSTIDLRIREGEAALRIGHWSGIAGLLLVLLGLTAPALALWLLVGLPVPR